MNKLHAIIIYMSSSLGLMYCWGIGYVACQFPKFDGKDQYILIMGLN